MISQKSSQLFEIIITSILVGLIWTIQVVHYPSFLYVGTNDYMAFHNFHMGAITLIATPLMIMEVLFAFLSLKFHNYQSSKTTFCVFFILIAIWLTTFFITVPIHNQLLVTKNEQFIHKLVLMNWIRTFLWTLKLFILVKNDNVRK
jgi:hypothetical protein